MNGTELTHRDAYFLARSQRRGGQRLKGLLFFDKVRAALEIAHANQIGEEALIGSPVGEIAAGSQAASA